jgi:hypothetical protein
VPVRCPLASLSPSSGQAQALTPTDVACLPLSGGQRRALPVARHGRAVAAQPQRAVALDQALRLTTDGRVGCVRATVRPRATGGLSGGHGM